MTHSKWFLISLAIDRVCFNKDMQRKQMTLPIAANQARKKVFAICNDQATIL